MSLTVEQVRTHLETGEFEALVGEFETEMIECKREPYHLTEDSGKQELAKDVSALANAEGGILLIGYATRKDLEHGEDRIESVRLCPRELINRQQYQQVLESWLYPPLFKVDIEWFDSPLASDKGILAIFVPKAQEMEWPVLIRQIRTGGEKSKKIGNLFGYFERKRSYTTHHSIERLQNLLRDGSRLDQEIREGFSTIIEMIGHRQFDNKLAASQRFEDEEIQRRLQDALQAADFLEKPTFSLIAYPDHPVNLVKIVESSHSTLVQLLENPPEIRGRGFDIKTGSESRLVAGKLRRTFIENYKLLELHRDGCAIFVANGDWLFWGRDREKHMLINQLLLVEVIYNFCCFALSALRAQPDDVDRIHLQLSLPQLTGKHASLKLQPDELDAYDLDDYRVAPKSTETFSLSIDLIQATPGGVAFLLLAEIYAWFGLEHDRIPYIKLDNGVRTVDPESILNIHEHG